MLTAREKRFPLPALVVVVAMLGLLAWLASPRADAQVRFEIRGKGFGHGVGMSQWGAFGQARDGRGYKRILRHYYRGTKIGRASTRQVRVLLSTRSSAVSFSGARRACRRDLKPGRTYRAALIRNGRRVRLERANGRRITGCGARLTAQPKGRIRIDGDGVYRGKLQAVAASGELNVVNKLGIDSYVKGVVPNEVPASWPSAALRAQAVAARSYALATRVNGAGFDLYSDVRSQVYGGLASEQPATNRAVSRTARQVVTHEGQVIQAFFFSTSGGKTERSEFGFAGGSPRPYLKSVKDPWDKASPHHRWRVTMSRNQLESRLGNLVKGRLRSIRVVKTGRSPRIVTARIIGSAGNTTISGPDLRFRLELRSAWARFEKLR